MTIEIGDAAPEFELASTKGGKVALSALRDRESVVLVFYPFTFTGVCRGELCELRDDLSKFSAAGATVVGVSCDSTFAQAKWAEEEGYSFALCSDFWPHGAVAQAYGVFDADRGCATRTTFVIDRSGIVVAKFASPDLGTPRGASAYAEALARLG
jgi:peroxiredoxin